MSNIRRPQMPKSRARSKAAKLRQSRRRLVHGKARHFKELFDNDTPFGLKIQTDRTKKIPREEKHSSDLSNEV